MAHHSPRRASRGEATPSSSPWSALLQENLNADDVSSFLNSAIARKEAALLRSHDNVGHLAGGSPMRTAGGRSSARPTPTSRPSHQPRERHVRHDHHVIYERPDSRESSRPGSPTYDDRRHATSPSAARAHQHYAETRLAVAADAAAGHAAAAAEAAQVLATQRIVESQRSTAQWQQWVLKAQQAEAAAREESRRLSAQLERAAARHAEEFAAATRAREELRGQLELRQFALQHMTEARDASQLRAERAEAELAAATARHAEQMSVAEAETHRQRSIAAEAQATAHAAIEQARAQAERAERAEIHAAAAERTCATLRLAVDSLQRAKDNLQVERDAALQNAANERNRGSVERALMRKYVHEIEARIPELIGICEAKERECERVESAVTAQILRIENAAERQRLQSERTVGQLRGHVAELEGAILEQQVAHEREREQLHLAHQAALDEVREQLALAEAQNGLLRQQTQALSEVAQHLQVEVATTLSSFAVVEAELRDTEGALDEAGAAAAAAVAKELEYAAALDEVKLEYREVQSQLGWLEACARDAAGACRPLLAHRDAGEVLSLLDADAAYADERLRWQAALAELHRTVHELIDAYCWLSGDLQQQLSASPLAGEAAAPAAELQADLVAQIEAAQRTLPIAFAPSAAFERCRGALLDAIHAQGQLASQSVSHLISCAADAEAMASLQARQQRAQHASQITMLISSEVTNCDALARDLAGVEQSLAERAEASTSHKTGLKTMNRELSEIEAALVSEAALHTAAVGEGERLQAACAAALDESQASRAQLLEASSALTSAEELAARLEKSVQQKGLEGETSVSEMQKAVRHAEEAQRERADTAAAAHATILATVQERRSEGSLLRYEIAHLEAELAGVAAELAAAHALCGARESQRDEARGAAAAAAAETAQLEHALDSVRAALDEAREDTRLARESAERQAGETVSWAARAQAVQALGDANARAAASENAALVDGLAELDDAVRRASDAKSRAVVENGLLVRALLEDEEARSDLKANVLALQLRLDKERLEEDRDRLARANARASQQAAQQAALAKELRSLQRHLLGGPLPPQGLHRLTNLQKPAGYGTPYYDAALDTAPTTEHAAHEDGELWASLLGSGAPYTGAFAHDETDSQGGYASRGDASEATDAPPREAFIPPPLPRPSPRVSSGALAQAPAAGLDEAGLVMAARIGLNVAGLASASGTLAALNEAVFATPATAARGAASVSRSSLTRGGGMIRPGH